jgi:hypothetical protein
VEATTAIEPENPEPQVMTRLELSRMPINTPYECLKDPILAEKHRELEKEARRKRLQRPPKEEGCFLGSCTVLKANGSVSRIDEVTAGDELVTSADGSKSAVVQCVLVTRIVKGETRMVCLENGLCVTPGHPVIVGGKWVRPKDLRLPEMVKCGFYYNFMLEREGSSGASLIVNGSVCAVLGHGVSVDMREHSFWGNWDALAQTFCAIDEDGWRNGRIEIEEGKSSTIPENQLIMERERMFYSNMAETVETRG